ncbi:class 1 fructose-bisphosphatase [Chitinilyticum litopenaei]|uniref:class 1 fructose-bisphosphatase n=1 Tax=Chitinilyticum litopenaei TaxID=1121276 RepID=UPI000402B388|nr:class 1 fructose-bisphosphatase [Chitinilyticum litopenaei]
MSMTLHDFLLAKRDARLSELAPVLAALAQACRRISTAVRCAAFTGQTGLAGSGNVQGEEQKKLDVLANRLMAEALHACPQVRAFASEEDEDSTPGSHAANPDGVLVAFDPLDGSSNLDINGPVGSIFSIQPGPPGDTVGTADFLQPGRQQLAAGYALYGPATVLVVGSVAGVHAFTLDEARGEFLLSQSGLQIAPDCSEFAINAAYQRHWHAPVTRYVGECLAGRDGPRGKDFNMRWMAAMVADVHRILQRGGVFLYPADQRASARQGKLRLLYEAAPMALLVHAAGGLASSGHEPILDILPASLHERVPVLLGARHEIERLNDYHRQA